MFGNDTLGTAAVAGTGGERWRPAGSRGCLSQLLSHFSSLPSPPGFRTSDSDPTNVGGCSPDDASSAPCRRLPPPQTQLTSLFTRFASFPFTSWDLVLSHTRAVARLQRPVGGAWPSPLTSLFVCAPPSSPVTSSWRCPRLHVHTRHSKSLTSLNKKEFLSVSFEGAANRRDGSLSQ